MRITTNFSSPAGQMTPYLVGVILLLSVMAVLTSTVLFVSARQISAGLPILKEQIARYSSREIPISSDLLPHDKLVVLKSQIQNLNMLTGTAGQSLPLLLARLEKIIPDRAWLVSLHYRAHDGETKLVVEADRAEILTEFMNRLDRSGYFSQVLLTRQTQRSEDKSHAIQFEIQLREKS